MFTPKKPSASESAMKKLDRLMATIRDGGFDEGRHRGHRHSVMSPARPTVMTLTTRFN